MNRPRRHPICGCRRARFAAGAAAAVLAAGVSAPVAQGQDAPAADTPAAAKPTPERRPRPVSEKYAGTLVGIKFNQAPVDMIIRQYGEWTGLVLMESPSVKMTAKVNLVCPVRIPIEEALDAIESVLAMHGIALVPLGERFLKVIPIADALKESIDLAFDAPPGGFKDMDTLVSQLVPLKHIPAQEANSAITELLHSYAKIKIYERNNSLLITETEANLRQVMQMLELLDQPVEVTDKVLTRHLRHAKASAVKAKLDELIRSLTAEAQKRQGAPPPRAAGAPPTRRVPASIRARPPTAAARAAADRAGAPQASTTATNVEERDLIKGTPQIIADDRINILIFITRPENMSFFDDVIATLDVDIAPDVTIEIVSLKYANVAEILGLLNSFIGTDSQEVTRAPEEQRRGRQLGGGRGDDDAEGSDDGSRAYPPADAPEAKEPEPDAAGKTTSTGRLSSDIKVVADERTNSMLIMANRGDMAQLMALIARLDIAVPQVVIEAVIIEISLTGEIEHGVDWLQRSMIAFEERKGSSEGRPTVAFAGGSNPGGGLRAARSAAGLTTIESLNDVGQGLTYFVTQFDYNIDAVIRLAASDSRAKILSIPIIVTTDNKPAKILIGERRPVVNSTATTTSGDLRSTYSFTDIGIDLAVTPHINKKGYVSMEVQQKVENVAGFELIDGNQVPIITTREFEAYLSVEDRKTIVLGGLVNRDITRSKSKIPFLGDIPILNLAFSFADRSDRRSELIVLLTPAVFNSQEAVLAETRRRKDALHNLEGMWKRGWSQSPLADPSDEEVEQVMNVKKAKKRTARREAIERMLEPRFGGRKKKL